VRSRRLRPCVRPCCPAPGSRQPPGRTGHRRGYGDHQSVDRDRSSPNGAAFSPVASTRISASSRPGHGSPIFTSGLLVLHPCCEHAGPLRHVAGFPNLGLLRVLRPTPTASADDGPSHRTHRRWCGRGPPGWFPRSLLIRSTGSAPSYAPAASPRLRRRPSPRPPDQRHHPAQEFPAPPRRPERRRRDGAGARCNPAPIRQIRAGGSLERRSAAGSSRAPFRLACRARTIWQYWPASSLSGAASTLPGVSRIELLPPASPRRYDDTAVKVSHLHSVQQRLVGLDVGDPQLVGVLDGEVAFEQVRCHCAGGESASFLPCRRR
jgi:hypothetical protein